MPNKPFVPVISVDDAGNETRYPSIKAAMEAVKAPQPQISMACITGCRCRGLYWRRECDQ